MIRLLACLIPRSWDSALNCPHSRLDPIWGDEINAAGGYRLQCKDCGLFLRGPVALAARRREEWARAEEHAHPGTGVVVRGCAYLDAPHRPTVSCRHDEPADVIQRADGRPIRRADECDRPPYGWFCTLRPGHPGPCPAWPTEEPRP